MEVPASIKHLPNIKLNEDEYEQGFDENLLITKELGPCFLCQVVSGFLEDPLSLRNVGMAFAKYA